MRNSCLSIAPTVSGIVALLALTMLGAGGCPPTMTPDPEDPNMISFARDVQPILDARCVSCHQTGGFANVAGIPLRLTSDFAVDDLLTRNSDQDASLRMVIPGDPDASLLVTKIEAGPQPFGSRMPLFGAALSDTQMRTIRAWIAQGARDN